MTLRYQVCNQHDVVSRHHTLQAANRKLRSIDTVQSTTYNSDLPLPTLEYDDDGCELGMLQGYNYGVAPIRS